MLFCRVWNKLEGLSRLNRFRWLILTSLGIVTLPIVITAGIPHFDAYQSLIIPSCSKGLNIRIWVLFLWTWQQWQLLWVNVCYECYFLLATVNIILSVCMSVRPPVHYIAVANDQRSCVYEQMVYVLQQASADMSYQLPDIRYDQDHCHYHHHCHGLWISRYFGTIIIAVNIMVDISICFLLPLHGAVQRLS